MPGTNLVRQKPVDPQKAESFREKQVQQLQQLLNKATLTPSQPPRKESSSSSLSGSNTSLNSINKESAHVSTSSKQEPRRMPLAKKIPSQDDAILKAIAENPRDFHNMSETALSQFVINQTDTNFAEKLDAWVQKNSRNPKSNTAKTDAPISNKQTWATETITTPKQREVYSNSLSSSNTSQDPISKESAQVPTSSNQKPREMPMPSAKGKISSEDEKLFNAIDNKLKTSSPISEDELAEIVLDHLLDHQ